MRSSSATATPAKVTSYWVSDATENCWRKVTPAAVGVDQEEIDGVVCLAGAGEHDQSIGGRRVGHVALDPVETETRTRRRRRASTPRGEKPLSGSSHAGVRTASPDATARSHWSFCRGAPRPQPVRPRPAPHSRSAGPEPGPGPAPRRGPHPPPATSPIRRIPRAGGGRSGRAPRAASTARAGSRRGRPPWPGRRRASNDAPACRGSLAQQLLLLVEFEVQHVSTTFVIAETSPGSHDGPPVTGRHWSPRRAQGLSSEDRGSGDPGRARRLHVAFDREGHVDGDEAAADVVDLGRLHDSAQRPWCRPGRPSPSCGR